MNLLQKITELENNAIKGKEYFDSVLEATASLRKELSGGSDSSVLKSKISKEVIERRMKRLRKK